ncbi:MAG TPA: hypothetical protein VIC58_03725 [Actinomycetota bacterium]
MNVGLGVALIVTGSLLGLLGATMLWRRVPAPVGILLLAGCGVCLGAGGLLVQEDAGLGAWLFTLPALGVFAPLQARLVFGPPGTAS